MIWDLVIRYQYGADLNFNLKWVDLEYTSLLLLIFINPRGIRIIVVSVFLVFIYFATSIKFFYPMSNLPYGLIYRNIFSELRVESNIAYIVHMILYLMFIYIMMKPNVTNKINNDLLDQ